VALELNAAQCRDNADRWALRQRDAQRALDAPIDATRSIGLGETTFEDESVAIYV